jgi:hypothetical protein
MVKALPEEKKGGLPGSLLGDNIRHLVRYCGSFRNRQSFGSRGRASFTVKLPSVELCAIRRFRRGFGFRLFSMSVRAF